MTNLASVIRRLDKERTRLTSQLEGLNRAISLLKGISSKRTGGTISAAGRARIAAAQRARWAKASGKRVVSMTANKRTMSSAARKRIVAAQKARWAKWRKQWSDGKRQRKHMVDRSSPTAASKRGGGLSALRVHP